MNEKITVVVTCFNNEKYIKECIDSILCQLNKKIDIEIILIEDHSTDYSLKLCKEIANNNKNVLLVIHDKNYGVEYSRNEGLRKATGEWVLFLDGDDSLSDDACEVLINRASKTSDIVISNYLYYDMYFCSEIVCNLDETKTYNIQEFASIIGDIVPWEILSCIGNKIYRRSFLKTANISFENKYKYNEDGAFIVKALIAAKEIEYTNHITYKYRKNILGSMSNYRQNSFESVHLVNYLLKEFFEKNKCGICQENFLKDKIVSNLINEFTNEVKFGSYECFEAQWKKMLKDKLINEEVLCNKMNNDSLVNSIINNDIEKFVMTARNRITDDFYNTWIGNECSGNSILKNIKNKRKKRIAIYGAAKIGRWLKQLLFVEGFNVEFFIDKKYADSNIMGLQCYSPNKQFPQVDIVISSVLTWNTNIQEPIDKRGVDFISIWDLFK